MSADNYYRIFREGDTYYPVMGFASDDEDGRVLKVEERHRASGGFGDPYKAFEWAESQNPEYGVSFDDAARPRTGAEWRLKEVDGVLLSATGPISHELALAMLEQIGRIVRDPA